MDCFVLNPDALISTGDEGYVAYVIGTRLLHRLNATAALILELSDGSRDIKQIADLLGSVLPESTIRDWVESAERDGLLVSSDCSPKPYSATQLSELANELRGQGRIFPAFLCQKQAAEVAPDDAEIWNQLGQLAHILGRRVEARDAYERYFRWFPDDAEVAHLLISLRDETPPSRASDRCIEQLYAQFASYYNENMVGELDYQAPDRVAEALAVTLEYRSGLDILDLGCGTGLSGQRLKPWARRLVGIDLSPHMVERAQTLGIYDMLETAEITAWLAAGESKFDVIVACDCMIYFGDLAQVMVPAARRLHPEGVIVFTVERGQSAPFRLTDSGRYTHHSDHIGQVAIKAGFTLIRCDEVFLRVEYGEDVHGLLAVMKWDSRDSEAESDISRSSLSPV